MKKLSENTKRIILQTIIDIAQWFLIFGVIVAVLLLMPLKIGGEEIVVLETPIPIAGAVVEFESAMVDSYEGYMLELEMQAQEAAAQAEAIAIAKEQMRQEMIALQKQKEWEEQKQVDEAEALKADPEYRILCAIIWAEAQGEGLAGQQAVGVVVINRRDSSEWPNTVQNVVYQQGQFQPVRDGRLNTGLSLYDQGKLDETVYQAAEFALNGNDVVNGMNFGDCMYFSTTRSNPKIILGGHRFG